ncbi:nicotinate phosphoribosyltransferase [Rhodothermaceae bacterium RA]|nr:nicotinate phosphoribosyltransferase [Rhodothermaceae bacterium RA]
MPASASWMRPDQTALFTDLYQLTMLQAYVREGMHEEAVFDLFVRRLKHRNYLLACGLDTVLEFLETLRFSDEALGYLASLDLFRPDFLDFLADFRFTGSVYALREGTPFFPDEPVLEVVAPIGQAQLVETFLLNQITFQTGIASKASRVVHAAQGRPVADFGMRRMHGVDAPLKAARAYYIAGIASTSNLLAGHLYGLKVTGTMAHSYIEAHDHEADAFRAFAELYPGTTLLVDTYDTLDGVRRVVDLVRTHGLRVGAIRLDSGDLDTLARQARQILDEAGLADVRIFASGSLDEHRIARLLAQGIPIDAFGVGTRMGTMADAPYLDTAYKLSAYAGTPRMKLSAQKSNLPGRKQVYRLRDASGLAVQDVIATADEAHEGEPLLECVMRDGVRTEAGRRSLDEARAHAQDELQRLPERLRALDPADPPYPVVLSEALQARLDQTRHRLENGAGPANEAVNAPR